MLIVVLILGVLAALVVPQFSSAATVARENSLRDDLRYLRTQVLVYRAQHGGVAPGYPDGDRSATPTYDAFTAQLTRCSSASGQVALTPSSLFRYGPYLTRVPPNPLSGSAAIRFVPDHEPFPSGPVGSEGWIYQPSTATLKANVAGADAQGVAYFDY